MLRGPLDEIVGTKLDRLRTWQAFLRQLKDAEQLVQPTERFFPTPLARQGFMRRDEPYTLEALVKSGALSVHDFSTPEVLERELENSRHILQQLEGLRRELRGFIERSYRFEDLF